MAIRFLSEGSIDQISGGYLYNRYVIEHLQDAGREVTYHATIADLEPGRDSDLVIVDGLALGGCLAQLVDLPSRVVLLLHVVPDPHQLGPDGNELLAALYRRSRVVVTGDSTLTTLRDRLTAAGVDVVKIEPGVPSHWKVKRGYADRARRLLGVSNYLPGKGIARLIAFLAVVRDLPWHLTVRGNTQFDPDHYRTMTAMVERLGLTERIALLGPVPHDGVNEEMIRADLLVQLSDHESYSMATAEAIACGLPVLSYPNGDADSFARSGLVRHVAWGQERAALRGLIERPGQYAQLRRRGPRGIRTWRDVGEEFVEWLLA